jgi:hypothetical protein
VAYGIEPEGFPIGRGFGGTALGTITVTTTRGEGNRELATADMVGVLPGRDNPVLEEKVVRARRELPNSGNIIENTSRE